ncbi:unnamed protein product [Rotaria magnacalcarata]|uniref:Uncharacterized protein n=1 Tax=Rotaria magnacalcarata TaxID=392030 RepID=A0A820CCC0_9BILA|nr:unnamed protein product [Rotaria magnacalcarata]CAF1630291.1 unnamed protein product [Rotaria magnacalcarata]CAF1951053.1 unnamed protein product [Rotaria magnacalcarata]CAF2145812.1 unnamed protein product [Rotaria magnacalcarata]CAF2157168.1 unnamed protein product [Rotaria magnacalcarata]
MENLDEKQEELESIESVDVELSPESIDETNNIKQIRTTTSVIQSLLLEPIEDKDDKKTKKKNKIKTHRQKELERLTKAANMTLTSPEQLNIVCERINSLLSGHKNILLAACHALDKLDSGRLPYEQFRLIIRDRLPEMIDEDIFSLTKLFEIEGLIDYQIILDEKFGDGILRYISVLPVPKSKEIVLAKRIPNQFRGFLNESVQLNQSRYVTVHLRSITFDSFNTYPGHLDITVPDHMSIYALSKMIIDKTDLATRSVNLFREKCPSRNTLLDPMRSLESHAYLGAYVDGTHNQSFPNYTLYYDHLQVLVPADCPILKCDYFMK